MKQPMTDQTLEKVVSTILRTGVIFSGSIVLAGGIYYLATNGFEPVNHRDFVSQPVQDRLVGRIVQGAFELRARSIIQLGILCLIATPIIRVGYSLIGFSMEGDRTYVITTAVVLCILLASLLSGAAGGV